MDRPASNDLCRGMSLIEVMIATTILVTGLSAVFSSMSTAKNVNDQATNRALAYQEIQAQIETYQYLPFISLQQEFKGGAFDVKGLRPPSGLSSVGTVTKVSNPNPYDTTRSPNPNSFNSSDTRLPIRFRCTWAEANASNTVEVIYVFTYRGI